MGQKPLDNLDLFDDLPNPVGRPKQFASNAERQKAYRARLKAQGKRVITKSCGRCARGAGVALRRD